LPAPIALSLATEAKYRSEALERMRCSGALYPSPSVLFFNNGSQLGQTISDPTIGSLGVKVGRTPDLTANMEGDPSKVAVFGCGEVNGAQRDGGADGDGADFKICQRRHGVSVKANMSPGLLVKPS